MMMHSAQTMTIWPLMQQDACSFVPAPHYCDYQKLAGTSLAFGPASRSLHFFGLSDAAFAITQIKSPATFMSTRIDHCYPGSLQAVANVVVLLVIKASTPSYSWIRMACSH